MYNIRIQFYDFNDRYNEDKSNNMHPPRRRPTTFIYMRAGYVIRLRAYTATPANCGVLYNIIIMYCNRVNSDYNFFFDHHASLVYNILYTYKVSECSSRKWILRLSSAHITPISIYIYMHGRIIIKNAKNVITYIPIGRYLRFNIIAKLMKTTLKEQH